MTSTASASTRNSNIAAGSGNASAEAFAAARLAAFGRADVGALVAHYRDDATVISPFGPLHGREQIKGMIEGIIAEFAQPGVSFELISQHAVGPIVTFSWKARTLTNEYHLGAETYVLEDGLVAFQTFAASVTPLAAH
jgi:ketosteroid isomerase-like protein